MRQLQFRAGRTTAGTASRSLARQRPKKWIAEAIQLGEMIIEFELQLDVLQLTLLTRGHELALRDLAVLVGVDRIQHAAELIELLAVKNALVVHVSAVPHTRAILGLGLGLLPVHAGGKR